MCYPESHGVRELSPRRYVFQAQPGVDSVPDLPVRGVQGPLSGV